MCELCEPGGHEQARHTAERLRELAKDYEALAEGLIKPHTDRASKVGFAARSLVRQLVEEWV